MLFKSLKIGHRCSLATQFAPPEQMPENNKLAEPSDSDSSLRSDRLLLREYQPSDAPVIERLLNDRQIASNTWSIDYPYPKGKAAKWIESQNALRLTGDAYAFAICVTDEGFAPYLIGALGLEINKGNHSAEIGYWIGRKYWNQGYCTEACGPLLDFAFERLGLRRVTSRHLARNPASGRVLEKLGFKREGLRRKHARKWGVFEDVVVYGLLAEDERP